MPTSWKAALITLALALSGCGGSFQSEEKARALIEREDAAMNIEEETAEEQADKE